MFVLEPCTTARYLCSFFSGNAIYPAREAAAGEAPARGNKDDRDWSWHWPRGKYVLGG